MAGEGTWSQVQSFCWVWSVSQGRRQRHEVKGHQQNEEGIRVGVEDGRRRTEEMVSLFVD